MRWAAFLCFGSKLFGCPLRGVSLYTVGLNGTAYRSVPPRICCGRFIPGEVITWGSFDNHMCLRIRIRVFSSKCTILFWNYFTLTEKVTIIVCSHFSLSHGPPVFQCIFPINRDIVLGHNHGNQEISMCSLLPSEIQVSLKFCHLCFWCSCSRKDPVYIKHCI